jgi:hypothetical protein
VSRLTATRTTIAALLVGAALTTTPAAEAAPYAPRCHFTCAERCDWDRCYDRCTERCRKTSFRRSRSRRVPPAGWHPQAPLVELILRYLAERVGMGVVMGGGALGFLAWVAHAIRRRHNLSKAIECEREANTHDHMAADLRAEADRLRYDI